MVWHLDNIGQRISSISATELRNSHRNHIRQMNAVLICTENTRSRYDNATCRDSFLRTADWDFLFKSVSDVGCLSTLPQAPTCYWQYLYSPHRFKPYKQSLACLLFSIKLSGISNIVDGIYVVFTARCTLVQSAVLRSHVVCPSVCLWRWWIVITYVGIHPK